MRIPTLFACLALAACATTPYQPDPEKRGRFTTAAPTVIWTLEHARVYREKLLGPSRAAADDHVRALEAKAIEFAASYVNCTPEAFAEALVFLADAGVRPPDTAPK